MDLRAFSQEKLWEALQREGYKERGFRTVRRWVEDGVAPTPEAERVIRKILGITKEAAPSVTRRLLEGIIALENRADLSPEERAQAAQDADAFERLAQVSDRQLAKRLEASQRTRSSRAKGPTGGPAAESPSSKRGKR